RLRLFPYTSLFRSVLQSLQGVLGAGDRTQFDLYLAARHAQLLDLAGHRLGQFLRGLLTGGGQLRGQLLKVLAVGGQLLGQAVLVRIALLDAFQFVDQALLEGRQLLRQNPMLARQVVDHAQTLFNLLLALGVRLDMIEVATEFSDGFLDLDLRAGEQVVGLAQAAAMVVQAVEAVEAGAERLQYAAAVAFTAD